MAEEDNEKQAEAAPAKKSNKMLFIIIGVVVVLIGVGAAAFFMLKKDKAAVPSEDIQVEAEDEEDLKSIGHDEHESLEEGEESLGAVFPLETFVLNLKGGRYIRIQIQLEFKERDIPKRFYQRIVPARDAIIQALTKKSADDVLTDEGKEQIKKEVKDIINEILRKEEVRRVYFTQYLVN